MELRRPLYREVLVDGKRQGTYCFNNSGQPEGFEIVDYWPVRIQLTKKGKFWYMCRCMHIGHNAEIDEADM